LKNQRKPILSRDGGFQLAHLNQFQFSAGIITSSTLSAGRTLDDLPLASKLFHFAPSHANPRVRMILTGKKPQRIMKLPFCSTASESKAVLT
jgi:hypothetical protein